MTEKIDTDRLKAALRALERYRHGTVAYHEALDIVVAAARTLLPSVLTYWRVEHWYRNGNGKLAIDSYHEYSEAAAEGRRAVDPEHRRVTGPHTWEIDP